MRTFRLDWGLPEFEFSDSFKYFTDPAARVARGKLIPREFIHPPLLVFILGVVDRAWSVVTGTGIPLVMKSSPDIFYQLTLLGRFVIVAFAVGSVGVLYLITRRLVGGRPAMFAAAAFALSPIHVLESHRANPDGPALFWSLLATYLAVVAADRRSRRHLYAAFVCAGAAAATKYTGLVAVTVPVWVALRWEEATLMQRVRICTLGGIATASIVALVMSPVMFHPDGLVKVLHFHVQTGFRGGMVPSVADWLSSSYVRFFAVLMPFSVGWAFYVLGLVGVCMVATGNRRALEIIAAAGIPFLLVQGSSYLAPPRWAQPIIPYLCLCAGVAMDRLWQHRSSLGVPLVVLALGYTGVLTASHVLRLGLEPQHSLSSWMDEQARHQPKKRLVVTYPSALLGQFDPLEPMLRTKPIDIVYSDVMLRAQASQRRATIPRQEETSEPTATPAEFQRDWLDNLGVAFIILPSMVESHIPLKLGQHEFYRNVVDGSLGVSLLEEFRTGFFTESLYVWADQSLNTHVATGIIGYKVYARSGADPTGAGANNR